MSLVVLQLVFEDPFTGYDIGPRWTRYQVLGVVGNQGDILLVCHQLGSARAP
jgi:hypothetical protein